MSNKIIIRTLITLLVLFSSFLLLHQPVNAKIYNNTQPTIKADEVINDDVFLTGENIRLEGTINGDVYAAGGTITVTGKINGDLMAVGGTLDLNGAQIQGDLRVAGGTLTLTDVQTGDNLNIFGGNLMVKNSTVGGTTVLAAGIAELEAQIGRNLYGGAGDLTLKSAINRETILGVETLTLTETTKLMGPLTYYSVNEATINPAAQISTITRKDFQARSPQRERGFGTHFYFFLASALIGLLIIYFMPITNIITIKMREQSKEVLGWGVVISLLVFPLIILLILTIIGIPLAFFILALLLILMMVSPIFFGLALGQYILKNMGRTYYPTLISMLLGLGAYYLLTTLPLVGGIVWLLARVMTLGAFLLYQKELFRAEKNT